MEKVPDDWEGRLVWLKDQATQVYCFNNDLDYWEVKERWHFWGYPAPTPTPLTERLKDAFMYEALWHQNDPGLGNHKIIRIWSRLSQQTRNRISDFFSDKGLHDFEYFDHGGWAMVFKARDRETGRTRIARVGCDSTQDRWRIVHPTMLPLIADNYDDFLAYDDLKLEIMPEIVPLHKLPGRPNWEANQPLYEVFHEAAMMIGWGTNITYPDDINDDDAEYHNVALLPDGRVVGYDPIFSRGDNGVLRKSFYDFSDEHKAVADRLYGMAPGAKFF